MGRPGAPIVSVVDLSGLIFVVLALAWVGYLVPRALRHHDQLQANRPVEEFSPSMRVLDRTPAAAPQALPSHAPRVEPPAASRAVRVAAARRRRRVLLGLLVLTAAVSAVAIYGLLPLWSPAIPAVVVFAWLVACRAAVRPMHRVTSTDAVEVATAAVDHPAEPAAASTALTELDDDTEDSLWDPMPLTLPTYVNKPMARRTIRTIDLTPAAEPPAPPAEAIAAAAPAEATPARAEAV